MARVTVIALAGAFLITAVPAALSAQDFRFDRPVATVVVQGGWVLPGEDSDLFSFTREHLEVEEGDFASPTLLGEAALRLTERLDLALGVEWAARTVDSEMREYVTLDDLPIRQSTEYERWRVMATLRGYLLPRGRRISQLAWVPNAWSPFVAVGGGIGWYDFTQSGDFVDFETLDIFEDVFQADGRGATWHAGAGMDVSLNEHFFLRGEYRYIGGDAGLDSRDFVDGFGSSHDLSGSQFTIGIGARI